MQSTTIIVTATNLDACRALAEANGAGPDNFSVALSADGNEPATHYGQHQWDQDDWLSDLPAPVVIEVKGAEPAFWDVVASLGLQALTSA